MFVTFNTTFCCRFGNHLFQYFTAKIFEKKFNLQYKFNLPRHECNIYLDDSNFIEFYKNNQIVTGNIYLSGFFQHSELLLENIDFIRSLLNENNQDTISTSCSINKIYLYLINEKNITNDKDLYIHVRLDDFMHQKVNSEVIHPSSYVQLIDSIKDNFENIYIICDVLKYEWEKQYINSLTSVSKKCQYKSGYYMDDFSLLVNSKNLVCSNSTFSWIAGLLGNSIQNWLPSKNSHSIQNFNKINDNTQFFHIEYLKEF